MGEKTKIGWTDSTANFWEGCTKVSPGCHFCYAEARDLRHHSGRHWGKGAERRQVISAIPNCLKWNGEAWVCDACGEAEAAPMHQAKSACKATRFHRRRVFAMSLGDLFDDEVPIDWLASALDTIRLCEELDFQILTKRPELIAPRLNAALRLATQQKMPALEDWLFSWTRQLPENVWLGFSAENQEWFDKRWAVAKDIPARVRFVSAEPLLGPIRLPEDATGQLHWVIAGGESGLKPRACRVEHLEDLRAQCEQQGIAFFMKQLGANVQSHGPLASMGDRAFRAASPGSEFRQYQLKDRKHGANISEFPLSLQVRQFPVTRNSTEPVERENL